MTTAAALAPLADPRALRPARKVLADVFGYQEFRAGQPEIIAAVLALLLHLFHVADESVLLAVALVILALLLVRDLRRESEQESMGQDLKRASSGIAALESRLVPPDTILVGPRNLRAASETFARRARGDMLWFNVCLLMFRPQPLFDALLRPAIENAAVRTIQFVLDESERERWAEDVVPKLATCVGRDKVLEPRWVSLDETVSFIMTATEPAGAVEAHLSFWGEPFMARSTSGNVPRYVFHVQPGSELLDRLSELERGYRLTAAR